MDASRLPIVHLGTDAPTYGVFCMILESAGALHQGPTEDLLLSCGESARQPQQLQKSLHEPRELTPLVVPDGSHEDARTGPARKPPLTPRLIQVVRLVSLGCTNTEIGLILHLSESTVDNYRTKAMKALGVHNSAGLTRAAFKYDFTSLDDELTEDEKRRLA